MTSVSAPDATGGIDGVINPQRRLAPPRIRIEAQRGSG